MLFTIKKWDFSPKLIPSPRIQPLFLQKTTFSSVLCFNHNTDAYLWKVDISICSIGRIMCLFHIPTPYPRFVFLTTPSHPSPSTVAQQMDALQPKSIKIQKYQTILQQKTQNLFLDFIPSKWTLEHPWWNGEHHSHFVQMSQ